MEEKLKEELARQYIEQHQQKKEENPVVKWITHILLALVIAMLIGSVNKMNDISDRLIRIEERSINNAASLGTMQNSINRIQVQQGDLQDRMTRIEVRQEEKK